MVEFDRGRYMGICIKFLFGLAREVLQEAFCLVMV